MNEATQRFFDEVFDSAADWLDECYDRAADECSDTCYLDDVAELYFVERLTRAVYQLGYGFVERIVGGPVDVVEVMQALLYCIDGCDEDEDLNTAFEAGYDCGWTDCQNELLA